MCLHASGGEAWLPQQSGLSTREPLHRSCRLRPLLLPCLIRRPSLLPLSKVTDFNLSKLVVEGLSMQSTQNPVNPRWLAPELVKGARATTASDVFSYGERLASAG